MAFTACEKEPEIEAEKQEQLNGDFTATVTVIQPEYVQQGVEVSVTESDSVENTIDVFLRAVKFSEKMPMTLDIIIPSVSVAKEGNMSGENIIPVYLVGVAENQPMPQYVVTNLSGRISYENGTVTEFSQSLNLGKYPTTIQKE